ncbi:MAG TPA: nitroreductase/quinone reductase family protein [Jatrophihabitantaceae bacterium]|nr:nitroreductase/quinone reductase family protein [Jatrophihabitantaceae bacterium]
MPAGQRGAVAPESGLPVVILTTRCARSGKLRKTPLMRVERDGRYVLVERHVGMASLGVSCIAHCCRGRC